MTSNFHERSEDFNSKGKYMRGAQNPREIEEQPVRKPDESIKELDKEMEASDEDHRTVN